MPAGEAPRLQPGGDPRVVRFPAAPLDRPTRWVSGAFVAVLAGLSLSIGSSAGAGPRGIALAVNTGLIGLAYGYAPAAYEISGDALEVVRRWFGRQRFRLTGPAQRLPSPFGLGGLRLWGSGGAFGWYGLFYRRGLGRYRAYLTDRGRIVALPTDRGLVVISPADPDVFLETLAGPT